MCMSEQNREKAEKFGSVEYMECPTQLDNMYAFLGGNCVQRSTVDHIVESFTGPGERK